MKKRSHTKPRPIETQPEVRMRVHHFESPNDHQEFLKNLAISSEFEMRYRGLLDYYGKEFIDY